MPVIGIGVDLLAHRRRNVMGADPPAEPIAMYDIIWPGVMMGIDWPGLTSPIDWPGI